MSAYLYVVVEGRLEDDGVVFARSEAVQGVDGFAGHGVAASIIIDENGDGRYNRKVFAGNLKLMEQIGASVTEAHHEGTAVYVAIESSLHNSAEKSILYAGCIVISDMVKESSKAAMDSLAVQGIKTIMLTGDVEGAAKVVAAHTGVSEYKAGLLPGDKVSEVEKLLEDTKGKGRLAFVGDGINDAPVLARADIGIAMGAMGSDAAIEAADIVLMDDDPLKIPLAMRISGKTLRIVRENIIFAIGVKVLCLILGALGIANMWVAIFADVGVMVLAVLNAARALRIK